MGLAQNAGKKDGEQREASEKEGTTFVKKKTGWGEIYLSGHRHISPGEKEARKTRVRQGFCQIFTGAGFCQMKEARPRKPKERTWGGFSERKRSGEPSVNVRHRNAASRKDQKKKGGDEEMARKQLKEPPPKIRRRGRSLMCQGKRKGGRERGKRLELGTASGAATFQELMVFS